MKKSYLLILALIFSINVVFGKEAGTPEKEHFFNFFDSLFGGVIGGILGVVGTILSSYYGPRRLEIWRSNQTELKQDGPRKKLLLEMLEDKRFPNGRRITTLSRVIGTSSKECRRLLIQIKARGITLSDDNETEIEGWVLIKNRPLNEE